MPSRHPLQRFEDILENIALIESFTAGMNLNSFRVDFKRSHAVERCPERISEAAKKLGEPGNACVRKSHGTNFDLSETSYRTSTIKSIVVFLLFPAVADGAGAKQV